MKDKALRKFLGVKKHPDGSLDSTYDGRINGMLKNIGENRRGYDAICDRHYETSKKLNCLFDFLGLDYQKRCQETLPKVIKKKK